MYLCTSIFLSITMHVFAVQYSCVCVVKVLCIFMQRSTASWDDYCCVAAAAPFRQKIVKYCTRSWS